MRILPSGQGKMRKGGFRDRELSVAQILCDSDGDLDAEIQRVKVRLTSQGF